MGTAQPMKDKEQGWTLAGKNPNLRIEETADGVFLVSDIDCAALAAYQASRPTPGAGRNKTVRPCV